MDIAEGVVSLLAVGYGLAWASSFARSLAGAAVEHVQAWRQPERDPVDEIHAQYRRGDIGEAELERQLELHMDTRNEIIRDELMEIDGIGGAVAVEVAVSFDSLGAVMNADRDALMDVPDVGNQRADDILSHFE